MGDWTPEPWRLVIGGYGGGEVWFGGEGEGMFRIEPADDSEYDADYGDAIAYGPSIVPHLLDDDENAGQRLRELLGEG